jgi:hypothetical protein
MWCAGCSRQMAAMSWLWHIQVGVAAGMLTGSMQTLSMPCKICTAGVIVPAGARLVRKHHTACCTHGVN